MSDEPRQPSSLRAQADELKLRGIEYKTYMETLQRKGRPKEQIGLMSVRLDILRDAWNTLEALAKEEGAVLPPPPAEQEPPAPPVDDWDT